MRRLWTVPCIAVVLSTSAIATAEEGVESTEDILRSYVEDFRHDRAAAEPITFAVRVTGEGGGDWHVVVAGKRQGADKAQVTLRPGLPTEPVAYFELDLATLRRIDRGELNACTATGCTARGSGTPPMRMDAMPGFELTAAFLDRLRPLLFHFWTRGFPERVQFRGELSGGAHGANAVVFYYQKGLRSAWFQVDTGQHINRDPQDQTNPFPSMFIMVRGKAEAKIGGKRLTFPANEMMFVPAGVTHEFWNPYDTPAEMIILMFGEGA